MNLRHLKQWASAVLLLAVVGTSGCKGGNIFGFRGPAEDNVGDLIAKGQEHLRDAEFDEALKKFAEAVAVDSLNSDARFFHAKAALLVTGQSIVTVLNQLTDGSQTVGDGLPIYSPDTNLSIAVDEARKTDLYQAAATIVNDLAPVARGETRGSFDPTSIVLDLGIANTLLGILQLRDINGDGQIGVPPDIFFGITRANNVRYKFVNLDSALLPPGSDPAQQAENVANFNNVISKATSTFEQALINLGKVKVIESAIDVGELEDAINDLIERSVILYYVNNGVPGNKGEGDNDGDGKIDEEILDGVDNDNDGRIDEDSHFP